MSDTSQGPGWWLASDGKWYPPQDAAGGSIPETNPRFAVLPSSDACHAHRVTRLAIYGSRAEVSVVQIVIVHTFSRQEGQPIDFLCR